MVAKTTSKRTHEANKWLEKKCSGTSRHVSKRNLQSNVSFCRQKGKATRIVEARLRCIKTDRHRTKASNERIIHKTLAYPMSQSTVSLRYSGSFSSLKSLWGEENNTENDEVGKEGRRPPKVAFLFSQAMQAASSRTHYFCPNKQAASSRASSKCWPKNSQCSKWKLNLSDLFLQLFACLISMVHD